jgi:hypothetical protein
VQCDGVGIHTIEDDERPTTGEYNDGERGVRAAERERWFVQAWQGTCESLDLHGGGGGRRVPNPSL